MPTKRVILYPYEMYSAAAKLLKNGLKEHGLRSIRVSPGGMYYPRANDLIVNWGNSLWPQWAMSRSRKIDILNHPKYVAIAVNKLFSFNAMKLCKVPIPLYTESPAEATNWLLKGMKVIARKSLTGHSGKGIEFCELDKKFPVAPLYVQYIPKVAEYRVHVFNNEVIDVQRKRRDSEANAEGRVDPKIRSHENGWVFTRDNCNPSECVITAAINAVISLGLNFGAVDVIVSRSGKAIVLEVNTAPGLEGQTITSYVNALSNLILGA